MEDPRIDQIKAVLPEFNIRYYADLDLLTGVEAIIINYQYLRKNDTIVSVRFIKRPDKYNT